MNENKVNSKNVIITIGVYCAYFMGASFSSGRETLQFFSGFGIKGYVGLALFALVLILCGLPVIKISRIENFETPYDVFPFFCGKTVGTAFKYMLTVLLLMNVIMMTSSAGANLHETLDAPTVAGRSIILISVATVCLGLDRIVDILSKIGPFVAASMILLAIVSIIKCDTTVVEGNRIIEDLDIFTGGATFWIAGLKYAFSAAISTIPILVVCGIRSTNSREATVISISTTLTLICICVLLATAQIKNMAGIYDYQIPNLALIGMYMPQLKIVFSLILFVCGYSTTTVMIWTIVREFSSEGTLKYYIITISLGIAIFIISGFFKFSQIMNYGAMLGMLLGISFVSFIFIYLIKQTALN